MQPSTASPQWPNERPDHERIVVGSTLCHGLLAMPFVADLRPVHFESWRHGAAYHTAVVVADAGDESARVLAAARHFRRHPSGYDLSCSDATSYIEHSTLVPATLNYHTAEILEAHMHRESRRIASEVLDRIEQRKPFAELATELLELAQGFDC